MHATGGYVRLYRALLQSPIWTQLVPPVLKVAIYFMLRANYKPTRWYDGATEIHIPAGSFITSYGSAATDCRLSLQQIRDAFSHLERTQFATYRRTHRWTLVSLIGYDAYEGLISDQNTPKNILGNGQGTTDKEIKNKRINTRASKNAARDGFLEPAKDPLRETPELERQWPARISGKSELESQQDAWFEEWWPVYWLRKGRKNALKSFRKQVRTQALFHKVMDATRAQQAEMLGREPKHRPYGATWLNGERWEDEISTPGTLADDDYPELKA